MSEVTPQQIKKPVYDFEGTGNLYFSIYRMIGVMVAVPVILSILLNISILKSFTPLFLITFLPSFCVYNIYYCYFSVPIRPQIGLPGKNVEEYFKTLTPELSKYVGKTKIPIEIFFENYFEGKIDLEGDMLDTLEARHDWARFVWSVGQVKFFLTQWIPETLWHSKIQDDDQVRVNYDRGNDFYEAFLGPSMFYTSGVLTKKDEYETLEQIQENKVNLVLNKMRVKETDKFIDVGCGWGGLSLAASKRCKSVTGVTIAKNQTQHINDKAKAQGLNVRILNVDYRDIPTTEKYDKIACLEMAEHVGILRFQTFLIQMRELLEDDGIFFMQLAGLRRTWQFEDLQWGLFMAKYIFPGADASTPLNWYVEQLERAGFEVASTETLGVHYSATLYRWYLNWMKNKEDMTNKYGKKWFRIWEYFLAYSTIVARQGSATVYQLLCHKNLNRFDRTQFINPSLER